MKIWVISSPPFLADFEKIASFWPKEVEYTITPVANYGINLSSVRLFLTDFKEIKPDIILTDHGYIGLIPLIMTPKHRRSTKLCFFLRGNYWLEEKGYLKDLGKYMTFDISITIPKKDSAEFLDKGENKYFYYHQELKGNKKTLTYRNIFPDKYKVRLYSNNKEDTIKIPISYEQEIRNKNFIVRITQNNNKFGTIRLIREFLRVNVAKIGWRFSIKKADLIITVCDYLKKEVAKKTKREATICPIGIEPIDINQINKINLKHPAVCLIQNHQIKQKSDALIEFVKVIKRLPNVNFYISKGLRENQNNENYLNIVASLKDFSNVNLVDIDNINKFSYLISSDVYVLATGLDCTPATILEAGLAAKPVIASKVGGVPEMIIDGKTGWAIKNSNSEEWIERIKSLVDNSKLAIEMGENNKKLVLEKYELSKIASRMYNLIKDIS